MSLPEYIALELQVYKPKLIYKLGQLVFFKKDPKKRPFVIAGFLPFGGRGHETADYICKRLTPQGNLVNEIFEQCELKTLKT